MAEYSAHRPLTGAAITYKGPGGYEVIEISERTVRSPGIGEVRITVKAAAVNPTDIGLRERGIPRSNLDRCAGDGCCGRHRICRAGRNAPADGEQVMAAVMPRRPEGGAQAQYIVVPAVSVVPTPEGVTLAQASTLPMNGLTALRALELAALAPGQWLAVSGGAGHLAHYAIAIAKRQGHKVIADATPEEAGLVRGYGADVVVERGAGFVAAIRREVPAGVEALLDTALLLERSFGAIRDEGVYIPVRGWAGKPSERGIKIKPVMVSDVLDRTEWLELLRDLVAAGQIKLRVTGEYAPERLADAQRALQAGGLRGRPVILF